MHVLKNIVTWHVKYKDYLNFFKDALFVVGLIATFYGYFRFLKFLTQRGSLNIRQEMENDTRMFDEVHIKLKDYVEAYKVPPRNMRNIGIRLLYIKNYPHKLDDDGFSQMLCYYFLSDYHEASGYISTTGFYVMEYLIQYGSSIYYDTKSEKWFSDEEGLSFRKYQEMKYKKLVKRIPCANVLGYDFNLNWPDKGEPVFYTKYKYYKSKLFADDFKAVNVDQKHSLSNSLSLKKNKRKKRPIKTILRKLKNKITIYETDKKRFKLLLEINEKN